MRSASAPPTPPPTRARAPLAHVIGPLSPPRARASETPVPAQPPQRPWGREEGEPRSQLHPKVSLMGLPPASGPTPTPVGPSWVVPRTPGRSPRPQRPVGREGRPAGEGRAALRRVCPVRSARRVWGRRAGAPRPGPAALLHPSHGRPWRASRSCAKAGQEGRARWGCPSPVTGTDLIYLFWLKKKGKNNFALHLA